MLKKKKGGGEGANWMDTYGDMVTLLLCFFVLLYSMSTISADKWKALVQSFNPDSIPDQTEIVGGNDGPSSDAQPLEPDPDLELDDLLARQAEITEALSELYETLEEYTENSGMGDSVEITKGDGYVFISFRDTIIFNGDSYELREEGKQVLSVISGALSEAEEFIDEVRVYGHTAQGQSYKENEAYWDRFLSSARAGYAAAYIQENSTIDPARIVSVGYGQHRPVAPNTDEENRSKNRRVEIYVTGFNLLDELGDSIEQYQTIAGGVSADETADAIDVTGGEDETAVDTGGADTGETAVDTGGGEEGTGTE